MSSSTDGMADSQSDEPINEIITLSPNTSKFEAGGNMYYIEDNISAGRYPHFLKMEAELGFGVNFSGLVASITNAYQSLNDRRDADAAVQLQKLLERSVSVAEKKPISLYFASLFINTADEDRSQWDIPKAEKKINDWANIDVSFFLGVCLARMRDSSKRYQEIAELIQSVGDLRDRAKEIIGD